MSLFFLSVVPLLACSHKCLLNHDCSSVFAQNELHGPRKIKHFDEKHREMRESQHKAMLKKKHDQKKKAKLAK